MCKPEISTFPLHKTFEHASQTAAAGRTKLSVSVMEARGRGVVGWGVVLTGFQRSCAALAIVFTERPRLDREGRTCSRGRETSEAASGMACGKRWAVLLGGVLSAAVRGGGGVTRRGGRGMHWAAGTVEIRR